MLITEDPTVTVKCRTTMKALVSFIYLCLSVKLDSLSFIHIISYYLYNYQTLCNDFHVQKKNNCKH